MKMLKTLINNMQTNESRHQEYTRKSNVRLDEVYYVENTTSSVFNYTLSSLIQELTVSTMLTSDMLQHNITNSNNLVEPFIRYNKSIINTNLNSDSDIHELILKANHINNNNNNNITNNNSDELNWEKTCLVLLFCLLIVITVIGNTLVILSVITTRRLRTVTNCFVMSLAVADWLVGLFVMPPAVMLFVVGSWRLGWILCDIWISLDVLLCTASILSLCAISVDRYLAVTQPLNYSKRRRSKRLALLMIFVVWLVALAITCPPYLGWYEQDRHSPDNIECRYNQNKGYVVFSAMGSFFIPMIVMLYVYSRICCVLTSRHHRMARTEASERSNDIDTDNFTSEYESSQSPRRNLSIRGSSALYTNYSPNTLEREPSHSTLYELVEISKTSSIIRSSTILCKYSTNNQHHQNHNLQNQLRPIHSVQFSPSQTSITESCLSTGKLRIHNNGNRMPIRISSLKRETKTAQTLSMVVGGFIACWLPFFIYYLLAPFLPKESVNDTLVAFLTWLGWINSAINPFIYAFYNVDFRIAFWRLTFRKFCKNQHNLTLMKT